jgi:hypothetical protein
MISPHSRRPALLLLGVAAVALASCGGPKGSVTTAGSAPPPHASWAGRDGLAATIDLLNKGDSVRARKALTKILKAHPDDATARSLIQQIDSDPTLLLGAQSFPYTVRGTDTLQMLAARFLGDPMKFYALGRYNDLKFPAALAPGQALRIPGVERVDKPQPVPRPRAVEPAPRVAPPPRAAAPRPAPTAALPKPVQDPARAGRLRAAGLEQLNRGDVNRAIGLLRQAQQAAPGNDLIARDLSRATRIQRAVQTKKQ